MENLHILERLLDPLQLFVFAVIVLASIVAAAFTTYMVNTNKYKLDMRKQEDAHKLAIADIGRQTADRISKRNQQIAALRKEIRLLKERVTKLEKSD